MKDESAKIKLGVLEERVNNMCKENNADHDEILRQIGQINKKLDEAFVTKAEWEPYKKGMITFISAILLAFLGWVIRLISLHQGI